MSSTRWFQHGSMLFEVDPGTPEYEHLLSVGAQPVIAPDGGDEGDLASLKVADLRALADERGLEHDGLRKDELVALLEVEPDAEDTLGE